MFRKKLYLILFSNISKDINGLFLQILYETIYHTSMLCAISTRYIIQALLFSDTQMKNMADKIIQNKCSLLFF